MAGVQTLNEHRVCSLKKMSSVLSENKISTNKYVFYALLDLRTLCVRVLHHEALLVVTTEAIALEAASAMSNAY